MAKYSGICDERDREGEGERIVSLITTLTIQSE